MSVNKGEIVNMDDKIAALEHELRHARAVATCRLRPT